MVGQILDHSHFVKRYINAVNFLVLPDALALPHNILVADLFLTSGYVSAWKHVAGIKLCARTAEALEDLLIQIAQAYIPNDDLIVRIPENEAEGELWSYEM